MNLLCRFYEPTGGRILIDGRDYTGWTLHGIHSRIGVGCCRRRTCFRARSRDNLRYGRLDASDAEVEAAARMAGAHGFIEALEDGVR